MKNSVIKEMLADKISYPKLTQAGNQRFDQVLSTLPPVKRGNQEWAAKGGQWRVLRFSTVAVAAAFLLLFGLNITFPAVAESIPVIGAMFKTLNYKSAMGSNAPSYGGLVQPMGTNTKTEDYQLTVREAYSEGRYVFADLLVQFTDKTIDEAQWLSPLFYDDEIAQGPRKEYRAEIEGQAVDAFKDPVFTKTEQGFQCAVVLKLPQDMENGKALNVSLVFNALRGNKPGTERHVNTLAEVNVEKEMRVDFAVTVNTAYNTYGQPMAEQDGVTLSSYESTPSYFNVNLSYPALGQALSTQGTFGNVEARTEDGVALNRNSSNTDFFTEKGTEIGEITQQTTAFDGVPAGTKKVIVTLYNTTPESRIVAPEGGFMGWCVLGEFTVDLEAKTAVPTQTYLQQGVAYSTVAEYLALYAHAPVLSNHVFAPEGVLIGYKEPGESGNTAVKLSFYTDAPDLPLEAAVFLNGTQYAAVPLTETADAAHFGPDSMSKTEAYQLFIGTFLKERQQENQMPENFKKYYNLSINIPELTMADYKEVDPKVYWQLRNSETAAVVFDSRDPLPSYYTE